MTDAAEHRPRLARAGVALLTGGVYFGGYGWAVAALGALCLWRAWAARGEGLRLAGPLLAWEVARPVRYRHLVRIAVAAGLAVAAAGVDRPSANKSRRAPVPALGELVHRRVAGPAATLAALLVLGAAVAPLLLVPPTLAADRANRRLDLLLGTPLTAREVLAGRALARLLPAFEPLALTLPLWAVLASLGAVSPLALGLGAAAVASAALASTGVALRASIRSRDPAGAVGLAALRLATLMLLTAAPLGVTLAAGSAWAPSLGLPPRVVCAELAAPAEFLGMFNPLVQAGVAGLRVGALSEPPEAVASAAVRHYAAGCLGLALWSLAGASERLRAADRPRRPGGTRRRGARRGAVWGRPLAWWEARRADPVIGRRAVLLALGVGLAVLLTGVGASWFDAAVRPCPPKPVSNRFRGGVPRLPERASSPFRDGTFATRTFQTCLIGGTFAGLSALGVLALLRGAACVARERAADTFESVLLTPLSARDILAQKLDGVCASLGARGLLFVAAWLGAALSGHLSWLTLVGWLLALPGAVAALVAFGAACGARSAQVGRAVVAAALGLAALGYLGGSAWDWLAAQWPGDDERAVARLLMAAPAPPAPFACAALPTLLPLGRSPAGGPPAPWYVIAYGAGVVAAWGWAYLFWRAALYRLRRDIGRSRGPAPERNPGGEA